MVNLVNQSMNKTPCTVPSFTICGAWKYLNQWFNIYIYIHMHGIPHYLASVKDLFISTLSYAIRQTMNLRGSVLPFGEAAGTLNTCSTTLDGCVWKVVPPVIRRKLDDWPEDLRVPYKFRQTLLVYANIYLKTQEYLNAVRPSAARISRCDHDWIHRAYVARSSDAPRAPHDVRPAFWAGCRIGFITLIHFKLLSITSPHMC